MIDQLTLPTIPVVDNMPAGEEFQRVAAALGGALFEIGDFIRSVVIKVRDFLTGFIERAIQVAHDYDRSYDRAALLAIYRGRVDWKKGDIKNLQSYPGLNAAARTRIEHLRNQRTAGRPKVKPYIPLAKMGLSEIQRIIQLSAPNTPPHERLAILKQSRWWLYYVDALYRGEYLRRKGTPNRSRNAEEVVAEALILSKDSVHRLRLDYRKCNSVDPLDLGVSMQEFDEWKITGRIPH